MGKEVVAAISRVAGHYTNVELDLVTGARGGRAAYLERALARLCQAEAATVVNNCAAALILILRHFTAAKPEVVISRGELVQIGGGFRIPEILEASGAVLREVGTTNKTSLRDYERAIGPRTGLLLKVHRSNFFMGGFVESADTTELAALARRKRVPLVEDLGSGALTPTEQFGGLEHERMPGECLRQGVELICFSGDKLLGGPQSGIIAGKARRVAALKREPFFRALRCDKMVLSGLQTVMEQYLQSGKEPVPAIPLHALLTLSLASLEARGQRMVEALQGLPASIQLVKGTARVGGGTQPRARLDSMALAVRPEGLKLETLAERMRRSTSPVVGHVAGNAFLLDLRTIFDWQDEVVVEVLRKALEGGGGRGQT